VGRLGLGLGSGPHVVGQLGSGPRVVERLRSRVRVSASFQMFRFNGRRECGKRNCLAGKCPGEFAEGGNVQGEMFYTPLNNGTSATGYAYHLRPHSIILASCKPGCKPGFRLA